jgi:hypothetical protein
VLVGQDGSSYLIGDVLPQEIPSLPLATRPSTGPTDTAGHPAPVTEISPVANFPPPAAHTPSSAIYEDPRSEANPTRPCRDGADATSALHSLHHVNLTLTCFAIVFVVAEAPRPQKESTIERRGQPEVLKLTPPRPQNRSSPRS